MPCAFLLLCITKSGQCCTLSRCIGSIFHTLNRANMLSKKSIRPDEVRISLMKSSINLLQYSSSRYYPTPLRIWIFFPSRVLNHSYSRIFPPSPQPLSSRSASSLSRFLAISLASSYLLFLRHRPSLLVDVFSLVFFSPIFFWICLSTIDGRSCCRRHFCHHRWSWLCSSKAQRA